MVFQQTYKEIIATVGREKYESFFKGELSQVNRKFKDDDGYLFLQLSRAILSAQANWGDKYEYKMKKLEEIFPIGSPSKILKEFEMMPFYKGFKYIESKTKEFRNETKVRSRLLESHLRFITLNAFYIYQEKGTSLLEIIKNLRNRYKNVLQVAENFSNGEFKLKGVGFPIAMEFLKNIGIDGFKPDSLIKKFFSRERLGILDKTQNDKAVFKKAQEYLKYIKEDFMADFPVIKGHELTALDNLLWGYCTQNVFAICGDKPKCGRCKISNCNKHRP